MFSPPTRLTRPPCGSRRPARMSSSVVLPPPFRPTTPIRSPRSTPSETASSSTRDASPGTCAVTDSRLTRLLPGPLRRRHQACTGGREAGGGSFGSTSRAPGTGPCTTRTVRHTPTPASWAATSIALSASAHRNAQVGPGTRDDPRERACLDPGPQGPAQLRCHAHRRRLQVVAQAERELARVAARDGLEHRLDVPLRGACPCRRARGAAGPARRRRRGVARPPRCRAITQCCGCRDSTGTIGLPAPGAQGGAAVQGEGDVAAELRGHPGQLVAGQVELPQRREPDERTRGVCAATGHAAGDGDALAEDHPHVRITLRVRGHQLDGAPGEVRAVRRHLTGALTVHLDARMLGRRDRHLVEETHRVEDRRRGRGSRRSAAVRRPDAD